MASLRRQPLASELAAVLPLPGVALRVLDPALQLLLTTVSPATLPGPGQLATLEGGAYAIWQAPDRWLLVGESGAAPAMPRGTDYLVSDLTDALALFEAEGPAAQAVLQQAMTFDLATLAPGQAAATLFAGLRVTVYPWRRADCWRLHVERASARYVWDWLTTAASAGA
jgi:heterotetrameric sarcosine oxidase gamma subunit